MYKKLFSLILVSGACLIAADVNNEDASSKPSVELVKLATGEQIPAQAAISIIGKLKEFYQNNDDGRMDLLYRGLIKYESLGLKDYEGRSVFAGSSLVDENFRPINYCDAVFKALFYKVKENYRLRDPYIPLMLPLRSGKLISFEAYKRLLPELRDQLTVSTWLPGRYLLAKVWCGPHVVIPNAEIATGSGDEVVNPYAMLKNRALIDEKGDVPADVANLVELMIDRTFDGRNKTLLADDFIEKARVNFHSGIIEANSLMLQDKAVSE